MTALVIGVDPGPTTGVVAFWIGEHVSIPMVFQCDAFSASFLIDALTANVRDFAFIAVEKFVVGNRSGRSGTSSAGAATRDLIGELQAEYRDTIVLRSASEVKPWATDKRLEAAGLHVPAGMGHAKDAARHALFAAVHSGLTRDPLLSKTSI